MNITSAEVKELTAWLHQDVDESIEDCGSLHLFKKYKRIYECLGLLQEILELDESNQEYECMHGYSDDDSEVKCMVANVVAGNLELVNQQSSNPMKLNDWFMSFTAEDSNKILTHGPFVTMESAMDKARELLGVDVFRSPWH
ncbi:hypothetical protein [Vibrio coralliilyticus]|uniref:hypothetical protein n=1 Tax=Vibrio coralliilyticus TaxID=190893 RepID=UPI00148CA406|nr:hypothetical protein [Vibrio coralliilyticus]NOI32292.1 hypothetical protein [Vibrio coralliilyticus]NOI51413.1 hypothetical protein [Vibrio coralliilyticus]